MSNTPDVTITMVPAEASVLRLQPGDRLIVRIPWEKLAHWQSETVRKHVSQWAGGVLVLVLPKGVDINVLRHDAERPPETA